MTRNVKNTAANVLALLLCLPAFCQTAGDKFRDGCCLNSQSFPRPKEASKETVSDEMLLKALNCATSSRLVGRPSSLANILGTEPELSVAYYFGKYMPEQSVPALTIGIYSRDGKRGMLLDVSADKEEYAVANIPQLEKTRRKWRVGEINGGFWSYTRLYYLAQEIGDRPRQPISLDAISQHRAGKCWVLYERVY